MGENANASETLVQDLIRLAGQAVVLHAEMTGDQDAEETFIRDQIAIGLYKKRGMTVSMEVTPDGFTDAVEEEKRAAYAQLRGQLEGRGFELDLIGWPAGWPNPHYLQYRRTRAYPPPRQARRRAEHPRAIA